MGAAVCAEAMHPDALLQREARIKKERKAHLKRLGSYHGNMITNLQKMKEIWEKCDHREELLLQIDRCFRSGATVKDHPMKNALEPLKRIDESVNLRERHWGEIREEFSTKQSHWGEIKDDIPAGQGHWGEFGGGNQEVVDDPRKDRTKRRNSKPAEEGLKRLKIKALGDGRDINHAAYDFDEEIPHKPKPKKRPVKTAEGATTLMITPSLEGRDMEEAEEVDLERELPEKQKAKRRSLKNAEEGAKRLKIKPSDDGGRDFKEVVGADFESKVFKKKRPKSKKQNTKTAEEGSKRLKIKSSEEGQDLTDIVDPDFQKELVKKQHAKKGENQSAKVTKKLKIKPWEEGRDIKEAMGGDDLEREVPKSRAKANKQSMKGAEGAQRLKIKSLEEGKNVKEVAEADLENSKKRKVKKQSLKTAEEKSKKPTVVSPSNTKKDRKGPVDPDLEREWFDKYVEVTVGPLSDDKLLNVIQSVKVTRKMFDAVKLRSEAGEEVHIDMLDPMEESGDKPTFKNVGSHCGDEVELIATFWRTVVLKDVPIIHASFVKKKQQQLRLAQSLASSCRNSLPDLLQRFETTNSESSGEEVIPSRTNVEARRAMTSKTSSRPRKDENASVKQGLGKHFFAGSGRSEVDSVPSGYSVNEHHAVGSSSHKEVQNHFLHMGWSKKKKKWWVSINHKDVRRGAQDASLTHVQPWKIPDAVSSVKLQRSPESRMEQHVCDGTSGENLLGDGHAAECDTPKISRHQAGTQEATAGIFNHRFGSAEPQELHPWGRGGGLKLPIRQHDDLQLHLAQDGSQQTAETLQTRIPVQPEMEHPQPHPQQHILPPLPALKREWQHINRNLSASESLLVTVPRVNMMTALSGSNLYAARHAVLPEAVPHIDMICALGGSSHYAGGDLALPVRVPCVDIMSGSNQYAARRAGPCFEGYAGPWSMPDVPAHLGMAESLQTMSFGGRLQFPLSESSVDTRWRDSNQNAYNVREPISRRPEMAVDEQSFYSMRTSRHELPALNDTTGTSDRIYNRYAPNPVDRVNIQSQHSSFDHNNLWPTESGLPKAISQLWGRPDHHPPS